MFDFRSQGNSAANTHVSGSAPDVPVDTVTGTQASDNTSSDTLGNATPTMSNNKNQEDLVGEVQGSSDIVSDHATQ
ncbi:hypothetical protein V6N13_133894 [Hibiscus sabdariffa]|uniref:Uncharacterized protein n=1 Tax=Hibiscus sabdariffa TaxID=183260 RepID=A0ABR2R096_9ROSI